MQFSDFARRSSKDLPAHKRLRQLGTVRPLAPSTHFWGMSFFFSLSERCDPTRTRGRRGGGPRRIWTAASRHRVPPLKEYESRLPENPSQVFPRLRLMCAFVPSFQDPLLVCKLSAMLTII